MNTAMLALFLRAMLARTYPRIVAMKRMPGWIILDTILPMLSVATLVYVYRAMNAPEEYVGFVILGGAVTAFWLNVIWSMGAQFYWDRDAGNLELYIAAPAPLMAILAGMAIGGMASTLVRATAILLMGTLVFQLHFDNVNWWAALGVFLLLMVALYGLGMLFASAFLLWGREAQHIVGLLQEPVYLLSGLHFPVKVLPTAVASVAAILPLTAGVDALRQILFPGTHHGWLSVWHEVVILACLSVLFIILARFSLARLERKARQEGRLTVRWL